MILLNANKKTDPTYLRRHSCLETMLALGSAIAYGVSDFTGGVLAKRIHVFNVILWSQGVSGVIIVALLPFWGGSYSLPALWWGAAAGVAGVSGAALLYRGLAIGRMGVVAPITAVLAAVIPVAFGLSAGERPGTISLIGVGVGLLAVVLISKAPHPSDFSTGNPSTVRSSDRARDGLGRTAEDRAREGLGRTAATKGVVQALGAGAGFGVFFILLDRTPEGSGLWPLVGTRISMLAVAAVLAGVAGGSVRPIVGTRRILVLLGFTNLAADLLYLLATRAGLLSLVVVITSLYPAATVALARVLLNERMVRQQLLGVGGAACSVALIALG